MPIELEEVDERLQLERVATIGAIVHRLPEMV